jgi:hypothetical protein
MGYTPGNVDILVYYGRATSGNAS